MPSQDAKRLIIFGSPRLCAGAGSSMEPGLASYIKRPRLATTWPLLLDRHRRFREGLLEVAHRGHRHVVPARGLGGGLDLLRQREGGFARRGRRRVPVMRERALRRQAVLRSVGAIAGAEPRRVGAAVVAV